MQEDIIKMPYEYAWRVKKTSRKHQLTLTLEQELKLPIQDLFKAPNPWWENWSSNFVFISKINVRVNLYVNPN
jgi:hypothetical protein